MIIEIIFTYVGHGRVHWSKGIMHQGIIKIVYEINNTTNTMNILKFVFWSPRNRIKDHPKHKEQNGMTSILFAHIKNQFDKVASFVDIVYILKYQIMAKPRQKRAQELNIKYDAVVSWIFLPSKLALNFLQQINNEPC